ncbi:MAG TPA: TrkA family potassium uptake protein [Chloroflexota bacterium]|nr:TrkA family potassium uptake protein [Chloroflexota bacterium]
MNVIIVGCGRMGSHLARQLSLNGEHVTVVDSDQQALDRLGPAFRGARVCGAALDRTVLLAAGIERADALVALTDSDDGNAVLARAARVLFRVPRAIARVYDPRKAEVFLRLGVQAFSTIGWGVNRIVEALHAAQWSSHTSLGGGEVELLEVTLPASLAGRCPGDVERDGEVQVVAVTRHGKTFLASPGALFEEGDALHVAVAGGGAASLTALGIG